MPALSLAPVIISSTAFILSIVSVITLVYYIPCAFVHFLFPLLPGKTEAPCEQIWLGIFQIWWKTWNLKFRRLTWGEAKHPHILEKCRKPSENLQSNERKGKSTHRAITLPVPSQPEEDAEDNGIASSESWGEETVTLDVSIQLLSLMNKSEVGYQAKTECSPLSDPRWTLRIRKLQPRKKEFKFESKEGDARS